MLNVSQSSHFKEILSVYSPRRVKKLNLTPGKISTFWRIVSLLLAFSLGAFAWHCMHYHSASSLQCNKHPNKTVSHRQEEKTDEFHTIPKNINELLAKRETGTDKLIVLYGKNIWSKFDTWMPSDWQGKCSRQDCSISLDASSIPQSSAVIYNALQMPSLRHQKLLQKIKRSIAAPTKFVFLSGITPKETNFDAENYDLFFDHTITYKKDSDIRIPYWPNDPILPSMYRQVRSKNTSFKMEQHEPQKNFFSKAGKNKFMLCILKTCKKIDWASGFIQKMREEGVVDIYTIEKCNESPIKGAKHLPCSDLLSDECAKFVEQYKFVTISSNIFCDGYIPREYWYALSAWQAVPVLWGCTADNLIKNTFINALDEEYISPTFKRAARASKDSKTYLEYSFSRAEQGLEKFYWQCELCKILHGERRSPKSLLSFADFWDKEQDCGKNSESYKLAKAQLVRTGAIAGS